MSRAITLPDENIPKKNVSAAYSKKEREENCTRISDLEKCVVINKDIITSLIANSNLDDKHKKIIHKLNTENIALINQINTTNKEKSLLSYKCLVADQINEEYRRKEAVVTKEFGEKIQEMKDQLNRKEYVLQSFEKKFFAAINVLKKYANYEKEIKLMLKELQINVEDDKRITNVVEENENLKTQIKCNNIELKKLRECVESLNARNSELQQQYTNSIKGICIVENTNPTPKVPSLNLSNIKNDGPNYNHKLEECIKFLSGKTKSLEEDNKTLTEEIHRLKKCNENLFNINQKLSGALKEANKTIKSFSSKPVKGKEQKIPIIKSGNAINEDKKEDKVQQKQDSFDNISSISINTDNEVNVDEKDPNLLKDNIAIP